MGNLCGKVSQKDNFSSPGRVVGTAPPSTTNPNPTSKIPPINTKKAGSSPRTLGGGGGSKAAAGSNDTADARAKAAEAAEARAQAASKTAKGKLGSQLAEQKKQTRTDTLNQVSDENRRARDMDAATEAINYN